MSTNLARFERGEGAMKSYEIRFPDYLDGYEVETEAKGYLVDVRIICDRREYRLDIYSAVRLAQDVVDEVASDGYFSSGNLLVVHSVNREEISRAIDRLATGGFDGWAQVCPEG